MPTMVNSVRCLLDLPPSTRKAGAKLYTAPRPLETASRWSCPDTVRKTLSEEYRSASDSSSSSSSLSPSAFSASVDAGFASFRGLE